MKLKEELVDLVQQELTNKNTLVTFSGTFQSKEFEIWLCGGIGETLILEHEPALNAKG